MRRRIVALLAAAAASASAAEGTRWYVQIDNDVFLSDRWYSSGTRVARVSERADHELELGLLHEVYTPETKRFAFGVVDRAPTARLRASVARHTRSPQIFQTLEVALGVRGPAALGRQVTELAHRVAPARDIEWSRQESNRFDGQLAAAHTRGFERVDLHYGVVLGNQVAFAHVGAELRIGARGATTTPALRHAATPPWSGQRTHGWGGFAGASVRGVARNEMLRRPYGAFDDPLERRDAVTRAGAGFGWSAPGMTFAFTLVQESREFDGQRAAHRFASFTAHADF